MKVLVIYTSPNYDGLTAACSSAAVEGARAAGAEVEEVRLNDLA
ncbi:MAG: NAD(P)H-dependent oxidoreductase, partial [Anaerolineae bacterium]|nr:NAD(P)H-dependent oxidoreductase [Anaerolineae bacterium]